MFYVALDETRDPVGRAMTAILVEILEDELNKPFLIDMVDVETPNYSSVQQVVTSALRILLGEDLVFDNFKLHLTDGASYCLKAGKALKGIFPQLIHVTCLCHDLNRVAELARTIYPRVNTLIAEIKKIFIKSAQRRRDFAPSCNIPLPSEPIITH